MTCRNNKLGAYRLRRVEIVAPLWGDKFWSVREGVPNY